MVHTILIHNPLIANTYWRVPKGRNPCDTRKYRALIQIQQWVKAYFEIYFCYWTLKHEKSIIAPRLARHWITNVYHFQLNPFNWLSQFVSSVSIALLAALWPSKMFLFYDEEISDRELLVRWHSCWVYKAYPNVTHSWAETCLTER